MWIGLRVRREDVLVLPIDLKKLSRSKRLGAAEVKLLQRSTSRPVGFPSRYPVQKMTIMKNMQRSKR
jgi:hypothetical protein